VANGVAQTFRVSFRILLVCLGLCAGNSYAWDQPIPFGASIRLLEGSYVPDRAVFQIDAPAANCPAGGWLSWEGGNPFPRGSDEAKRQQNVRSTYASLLAALMSGKRVNVYARNTTAQEPLCIVEHLHINP
jgi:hypothetical protein